MNERAREVLVEAAMRGLRQISGQMHAGDGVCGLGALHLAAHEWDHAAAHACMGSAPYKSWEESAHRRELVALYDLTEGEIDEIVRANDDTGWDFLTIARKVGVSDDSR